MRVSDLFNGDKRDHDGLPVSVYFERISLGLSSLQTGIRYLGG